MTTFISDVSRSLYDLLAEPAPPGTYAGETRVTATKETLDDDTETVPDDDILNL